MNSGVSSSLIYSGLICSEFRATPPGKPRKMSRYNLKTPHKMPRVNLADAVVAKLMT